MKIACATLTMLLAATALPAQELSVAVARPMQGDLMFQSGAFTAGRSYVGSGHCPADEKRRQVQVIRFDPPFGAIPQVLVSLNYLDFDIHSESLRNPRVSARAESVSRRAMVLVVETWCDTNLARAGGTYLAMGPSQVEGAAAAGSGPPVVLEQLGPRLPFEGSAPDGIDDW